MAHRNGKQDETIRQTRGDEPPAIGPADPDLADGGEPTLFLNEQSDDERTVRVRAEEPAAEQTVITQDDVRDEQTLRLPPDSAGDDQTTSDSAASGNADQTVRLRTDDEAQPASATQTEVTLQVAHEMPPPASGTHEQPAESDKLDEPVGEATIVTGDDGKPTESTGVHAEPATSDKPGEPVGDATILTDNEGKPAEATVDPQSRTSLTEPAGDVTRSEPGARRAVGMEPTLATSDPARRVEGGPADSRPSAAAIQQYRFVEEIARGGMGRIMRAVDPQLHRDVACKLLLDNVRVGTSMRQRFVEEAQITGQLEHPGIVPVHELGRDESGNPYYTMKLIRGTSLKTVIREFHELPPDDNGRRLLFTRLLNRFVDVCNTIAFAHRRGVLHRDLKPDNVMLGDFGETLVVDWGLAKVVGTRLLDEELSTTSLDGSSLQTLVIPGENTQSLSQLSATLPPQTTTADSETLPPSRRDGHSESVQTDQRSRGTETRAGEIMGTLKYMSPEQSEGRNAELDARSDVYSLGAILYDILTGKRTLQDGKLPDMLEDIRAGNIPPPREVAAWIPRPLEAVCLKALATDRRDRYPSALALAGDIESWLADEPVSAYEDPWTERLRRWARARRTLVVGTLTALSVLVVAVVAWFRIEAWNIAQTEADARQLMAQAVQAAEDGQLDAAAKLLLQADTIADAHPQLVDLGTAVAGQKNYLDQLTASAEAERVRVQRSAAKTDLAAARERIAADDLAEARDILTRLSAQLSDEAELQPVSEEVATLSQWVTARLTEREATATAQAELQQFHELADLARQHASLFTGERIADDIRKAKTYAEQSVELYSLTQPWQSAPEHLTRDELQEIRATGFELLLLLAEIELTAESAAADDAAAEAALQWIDAARDVGFRTRTLELRRAECFDRLGRANSRDVALSAADKLLPRTRLDFFLVGEYERKAGRLDNAVAAYRQALSLQPDDFWSAHFLGICLYQQNQPAAAVAYLTSCVADRPDFVWTYLARAVAYAGLDDFDSAYDDLATAETLEPDLFAIGVNRGGLLLQQGRLREAVEQFEKSAQLDESRFEPWLNLGEARRRMAVAAETRGATPDETKSLFAAAAQDLDQAVQRGGDSRVHRVLGDVHRRLGDLQLALNEYNLAATQERDDRLRADDVRQAGSILFSAGQFDAARTQYETALKLDPNNGELQQLLGESLIELGQFGDAIAPLTRAIELSGPNADRYRARGLCVARLGRYREAMDDYTRSLALDDEAPNILARRGWAYLLYGNDLALQDFRKAVELNPDSADSYNGLAYALVESGNTSEAVASARMAVRKAEPQLAQQGPQAWSLLYNAATVLAQASGQVEGEPSGDYASEAIDLLKRALEVAGRDFAPTVLRVIRTDKSLSPLHTRDEFQSAFSEPDSNE